MASYTLPERIVGTSLFVPDTNDFFEIGTGVDALPNGDDCLIVRGDLDPGYRAFQPTQVVSPAVFTSKAYTVFNNQSIVFWVKCSVPPAFSGVGINQAIMMQISTPTWNPTTVSSFDHQGGTIWTLAANSSSINELTIYKNTASSGGGASTSFNFTVPVDTWTMVTIIPGASAGSGVFLNDSATNVGGSWASGDGTFPNTSITSPSFFSIGHYSDGANLKNRADRWSMGKLSFHSGKLNQTQRALLHNAMAA